MKQYVLIVEDDPAQRRILEEMIKRLGLETMTAEGGFAAIEILDSPKAEKISAMLLDLVMPECDGMDVLLHMEKKSSSIPVIVQTAQGSIETVVKAMRAGADDFVVKPVSPERLKVSLQNLLKVNALTTEVKRLQKKVEGVLTFDDLIASSPAMANVMHLGRRAAQSNIPILIEGESGVGKEVIARAIQGESERRGRPLITVNCGAIPENLVESILFGHEKGSFTGATSKDIGKFQEASGGTLFLDEVGELPLDMQAKLLRVLERREVKAVGSDKTEPVEVRVVAATNRNLARDAEAGSFRQDLYFRLAVVVVRIPPLRTRMDDLPMLVDHIQGELNRRRVVTGQAPYEPLGETALGMLRRYDFPGNVRELRNAIENMVLLTRSDVLGEEDVPERIRATSGQNGSPHGFLDLAGRSMAELERAAIEANLEFVGGNRQKAAKILGIGERTLYRKLKEYGIST